MPDIHNSQELPKSSEDEYEKVQRENKELEDQIARLKMEMGMAEDAVTHELEKTEYKKLQ